LQVLFEHVPVDSGMAFVVITPLARGRVSSLVEILARFTGNDHRRLGHLTRCDGSFCRFG
jgi:hypothetical protein